MGLICRQPWGALCLTAIFDHAKWIKDYTDACVNVYANKETFDTVGVKSYWAHHISNLQAFMVGSSWHVVPFELEHDQEVKTMGFQISTAGEKLIFLTDTSYCRYKFKKFTRLMIECNFSDEILERRLQDGGLDKGHYLRLKDSHMSLARVKDFLRDQDISCLKSIHLIHLSAGNSSERVFKEEIQKLTGLPVYVCAE